MRNHQRILDAQKHLLHTLLKLNKKIIDNYTMNMSIERNVYIVSNIFSIDVSPQQGLEVAANAYSLDVRNHHRICDAQKHLLHTLLKLKKKIIDNYMMNKRIEENVYIVSNIFSIDVSPQQRIAVAANAYSLDVRNHHRIWDAQKHLLHTLVKLKKLIIDN